MVQLHHGVIQISSLEEIPKLTFTVVALIYIPNLFIWSFVESAISNICICMVKPVNKHMNVYVVFIFYLN